MSSVQAPAAKPHDSYQHEAFLYRGHDDFLDGTVDFVREGLALSQPVMVAVPAPRLELIRQTLGSDADDVLMVDMYELGRNPARIIPAWRTFVDERGGPDRPIRGIGEPVWAGRRPVEIEECQLHEALLNLAIDPDLPLWLRCPYDVSALEDDVVDRAFHSHPAMVESATFRGSTSYGGALHASDLFGGDLPAPADDAEQLAFGAHELDVVRSRVTQYALAAGLDDSRARDLVLAVSELATNSVRHGAGWGTVSMWLEGGAVVCDVRDAGQVSDPLTGRRTPSLTEEGGRGMWIANQLCDLVQLRSSDRGTVVRARVWLPPQGDRPSGRTEMSRAYAS